TVAMTALLLATLIVPIAMLRAGENDATQNAATAPDRTEIDRLLSEIERDGQPIESFEATYEAFETFHPTIMPDMRNRRIEAVQRVAGDRFWWDVTIHDGTLILGAPVRFIHTFDGERMMN